MKISQNTSLPLDLNSQAAQLRRAQASESKSAEKSTEANADKDEVRISRQAKELAVESSATADSARQQKIDSLKRSIENGTYRVEPDKVAKAMISEFAPSVDDEEQQ